MRTIYKYDDDYEEEAILSDGTTVIIRAIQPHDKVQLLRGFERLSRESRYLRFFTYKSSLTEHDLRYLTEIDGFNHFALIAVKLDPIGRQEGVGVARFVRVEDQSEVAEPAVAVVDDQQGKGLGTLLLSRLAAAGWERGVRRFHAEFLAENIRMRHLFKSLVKDEPDGLQLEHKRDVVLADMPVPEGRQVDGAPKIPRQSAVRELLLEAARGAAFQRFRQIFRQANPIQTDENGAERPK